MVRQPLGPAHRAEQNGILRAKHFEKIIRHDLARLLPVFVPPGERSQLQGEAAVAGLRLAQDAQGLGDHLGADAVARVNGNAKRFGGGGAHSGSTLGG